MKSFAADAPKSDGGMIDIEVSSGVSCYIEDKANFFHHCRLSLCCASVVKYYHFDMMNIWIIYDIIWPVSLARIQFK